MNAHIKKFLIKFFVCLIIFGTGYALLFVVGPFKPQPISSNQSSDNMVLANSLKEIALRNEEITSYSQTGPESARVLNSLVDQLNEDITGSKALLNKPSLKISHEDQLQLNQIMSQEEELIKKYRNTPGSISKAVAYNPEKDLLSLDISKDRDELTGRAQNAVAGLERILQPSSQTSGLTAQSAGEDAVNSQVNSAIQNSTKCFSELINFLKSNKLAEASSQRKTCTNKYEETRESLIQNTINRSFGAQNEDLNKDLRSLASSIANTK